MRNLIKDTWLISTLFVTPILLIELLGWATKGYLEGFLIGGWATLPAIALVITPCVWWWVVARRRSRRIYRGVLAGVLCASLILLVPTVDLIRTLSRPRPPDSGLVDAAVSASFMVFWVVAVPLGAIFGALVVALQRRGWDQHSLQVGRSVNS
jgi:hypothetical protein